MPASRNVKTIVQDILTEWHGSLSVVRLHAEVQNRRNKILRVEEVPATVLGPGTTGCVLALKDVDLICIRAGLYTDRALYTLGHECGHLLLNHVPRFSPSVGHFTYHEFVGDPHYETAVCRGSSTNHRLQQ